MLRLHAARADRLTGFAATSFRKSVTGRVALGERVGAVCQSLGCVDGHCFAVAESRDAGLGAGEAADRPPRLIAVGIKRSLGAGPDAAELRFCGVEVCPAVDVGFCNGRFPDAGLNDRVRGGSAR